MSYPPGEVSQSSGLCTVLVASHKRSPFPKSMHPLPAPGAEIGSAISTCPNSSAVNSRATGVRVGQLVGGGAQQIAAGTVPVGDTEAETVGTVRSRQSRPLSPEARRQHLNSEDDCARAVSQSGQDPIQSSIMFLLTNSVP